MPTLAAVEAESMLDTLFLFFWDQFHWKFDHINIYSIEVLDHSRRGGKRLESLSGPSTVLGNLFCSIPLVLEVDSLGIPVIDLIRDSVNGCYDSPLFFSFGLVFSFLAITHPSHVIGPLTTLVFIIASFHPLLQTSMTYICLLVVLLRDSIAFHCIPFALSLFWNFPESQVYKPLTRYIFP